MKNNKTTYIIFGASGDLSRRYLIPALENMKYAGDIVLVSRKDYGNLKNLIKEDGEKIFHLAIPPEAVANVIEIISNDFGRNNVKIMLEKPFGNDLKSAQDLIKHIDKYFSEDQIYRVDHYLAKKSLEKVVTEKWDRNNISNIEIIASERIDIEGRVNFYEQTGALKDFMQSHLMEMAAIVLSGSFETSRREVALKNLKIVCDIEKRECVKRGQYEGYKEEVNNPDSRPCWLEDDKAIMFDSGSKCDLATCKVTMMLNTPLQDPDASPDCKRVAFCENVPGKGQFVFTIKMDGTDKKQITAT